MSYQSDTLRHAQRPNEKEGSTEAADAERYHALDALEAELSGVTDTKTGLPLPPFLRPNDHRNKLREYKLRRSDESSFPDDIDIYVPKNKRTLAQNQRFAPFSTAFAQNPYAHALAESVRQDCFTNARLPASCLLGFHLVETGIMKAGKATETEISLLPLSLAAELVSKKKNPTKLTEPEKIAVDGRDEDRHGWAPQGTGSYILNKRAVLDFVSEDPKRRVKRMAVTRRLLNSHGSLPMAWREDMSDYVLEYLRRIVVKRLGHFFRSKTTKDKFGKVCTLPGGEGLERLDLVDDVMCILRLRPKTEGADRQDDPAAKPESLEDWDFQTSGELASRTEEDIGKQLGPDPDLQSIGDDFDVDTRSESQKLARPNKAQTHPQRLGGFREKEPIFSNIWTALPPPTTPSSTYFPTLPYRNRRVAGYNLPYLLGGAMLEKLLKDTVFADSEYVVVTAHQATVGVNLSLLKLTAYISEGKEPAMLV